MSYTRGKGPEVSTDKRSRASRSAPMYENDVVPIKLFLL